MRLKVQILIKSPNISKLRPPSPLFSWWLKSGEVIQPVCGSYCVNVIIVVIVIAIGIVILMKSPNLSLSAAGCHFGQKCQHQLSTRTPASLFSRISSTNEMCRVLLDFRLQISGSKLFNYFRNLTAKWGRGSCQRV